MTDTDSSNDSLPWVIVGYGRVGQSLKLLADRIGAVVDATYNRTRQTARAASVRSPNPLYGPLPDALAEVLERPHLVWLTVSDDAIGDVCDTIADKVADGSIIVHTSGSLPSTILAEHTDLPVASLHPLQAISEPRTALQRFADSFWAIEGNDEAVDYLTDLVADADIVPTRIDPATKLLYHASAATAANLLVSLIDTAIDMATNAGIDAVQARHMLVNLAESSLANLADRPPAQALTGPSARGDIETIDRHRDALADLDDDSLLKLYNLLTDRALDGLGED